MTSIFLDIKMIVFDLDCTITNLHTCPTTTADQVRSANRNVYIQADVFKKFIHYLIDTGVEVAIATYGKKEVTIALMDQVFGIQSPFHDGNILTPADVSFHDKIKWLECRNPPITHNKNNMLSLLAGRYQLSPDEILLIDDTIQNIVNAKQAGYHGVLAPNCKGFRATLRSLIKYVLSENDAEKFIEML